MKIVAVGSPKGGVGKTTSAVTLAAIAAKAGLRVLLVDGDENRSAWDWAGAAGDEISVDVHAESDPRELARLRDAGGYDLMVVDLPGAKVGAFEAILTGDGRRPVPDLLVVPTAPEVLDLRPVLRVLRDEVVPLQLAHLVVFTKVRTASLPRARQQRALVLAAGAGYRFTETIVRDYAAYDEAVEAGVTVLDLRSVRARQAEADYRALADEVLTAVGLTGWLHRDDVRQDQDEEARRG